MSTPNTPRTFYRAIRRKPPTREQFLPQGKRDIKPRRPLTAEEQLSWDEEISTFDTLASTARNAIAANPGEFQAEIVLPPESDIGVRQDPERPRHYNLRGDADAVLAAVPRVWHPGTNRIVWTKPARPDEVAMNHFEIWDMETANKIGSAPSREAALALVRDFLTTGDVHYQTNLSLGEVDADGDYYPIYTLDGTLTSGGLSRTVTH